MNNSGLGSAVCISLGKRAVEGTDAARSNHLTFLSDIPLLVTFTEQLEESSYRVKRPRGIGGERFCELLCSPAPQMVFEFLETCVRLECLDRRPPYPGICYNKIHIAMCCFYILCRPLKVGLAGHVALNDMDVSVLL